MEDLDRRVDHIPVLLEEPADVNHLIRIAGVADDPHELLVLGTVRFAAVPPVPGYYTAHGHPVGLVVADDVELVVRSGDVRNGERVGEADTGHEKKHEHGRDPLLRHDCIQKTAKSQA